jgi:hypothetical protein
MFRVGRAVFMGSVLLFGVLLKIHGQTNPVGNPLIRDALLQANSRLVRPKCRSIFGPDAVTALLSATYRLLPLGSPLLGSDGKFHVLSALTLKAEKTILINSQGPFANPKLRIHGVQFNYGLGDQEYRAFLLLHELGHLVGRFKPDGRNAALSRQYTDIVITGCFPPIRQDGSVPK